MAALCICYCHCPPQRWRHLHFNFAHIHTHRHTCAYTHMYMYRQCMVCWRSFGVTMGPIPWLCHMTMDECEMLVCVCMHMWARCKAAVQLCYSFELHLCRHNCMCVLAGMCPVRMLIGLNYVYVLQNLKFRYKKFFFQYFTQNPRPLNSLF